MPSQAQANYARAGFWVEPELHARIKAYAAEHGYKLAWLIQHWLEQSLEEALGESPELRSRSLVKGRTRG